MDSLIGSIFSNVYFLPVIVAAILAFPFVMMRLMDRLYAQYRAGNMAQRMGLKVAEGDPKLNLLNALPLHNFKLGTATGGSWLSRALMDSTKETKVHLVGAPHGRPTEFVYCRRHDTKDRLLVVTTESWFECRLSVQVPAGFPEFEIVRQRPHMGVYGPKPEPELPLPPQPFGDREVDRHLKLTTSDPRLGPALAPVVAPLARLEFVHVQGRNGAVHWLATEDGSPYAIRRLPEAQRVLERIADVLAGPVRRAH
jgi:hypothetical protein